MNKTEELITFTKQALGLHDYHLYSHHFQRKVNLFNETVYTLEMEWFPAHIDSREEDGTNPRGTACIEIDVHTRQFQSIVFVGGQTAAKKGQFTREDGGDVIEWVEKETGLIYGQHFYLIHQERGKLRFAAGVDGTPVSPSGSIEIEWDDAGRLTFYAKYGYFPSKQQAREERFSLTLEQIQSMAREQLKLLQVPSQKEQRIMPVYALEEIYISNDLSATIPFEPLIEAPSSLSVDEILHWETPLNGSFHRQEVEHAEVVTPAQAFSGEASPDANPISPDDQQSCVHAVLHVLRQEYPQESGQWRLKTLYRDQGYIHAVLRRKEESRFALKRKLVVIIDPHRFEVLNYVDNLGLLEMFSQWPKSSQVAVTKEEAYDKLKDLFTLTPTYVYDQGQRMYRLCGQLDCTYGVQAENGQVLILEEF